MVKRLVFTVLAAVLAACTPTHTIRVNADGPVPRVEEAPEFVGAGERVRVVVADSVWGNRWVAAATLADLATIGRSLVFGSGELSKLTKWFAPATRPAADPGIEPTVAPVFTAVRTEPVRTAAEHAAARSLAEVLDSLNTVHSVVQVLTEKANAELTKLDKPELLPFLQFTFDNTMHRLAARLASDTTGPRAADLLGRLATGQADRPTPEQMDAWVVAARGFAQRLAALAAFVPPGLDDPMVEDLSQTITNLRDYRAQRADSVARRDALLRRAETLARQSRATVRGQPTDAPLKSTVRGIDLSRLLEPGAVFDLPRIHADLQTAEQNARRLAAALNQLPAWAKSPGAETIMTRVFAGPKEVSLKIVRHPRYGTFSVVEEAAPASGGAASTGKSAPASGKGADAKSAGIDGNAADANGANGRSRISEVRDDTVRARLEVLPRYRFHVGAGLVWSPLGTHTYATSIDTVDGRPGVRVRQTGFTPNQLIPIGLLSYNILPLGGKTFDAREYHDWPSLEALGLSLQVGVSLRDPAEHVFFGASTEPFPGLMVGYGHHLGYVERSRKAPGSFVADEEGPAIEKHWRGDWNAWSLGVDAIVFFKTLGSLF